MKEETTDHPATGLRPRQGIDEKRTCSKYTARLPDNPDGIHVHTSIYICRYVKVPRLPVML